MRVSETSSGACRGARGDRLNNRIIKMIMTNLPVFSPTVARDSVTREITREARNRRTILNTPAD